MAISDKLDYLLDTKQAIKQAIIDKGQEVADTDTFRSYAEKIEAIAAGGGDTIPIGLIDGTLETFNAGGAEIVAPYRCYEFKNLKSVDLTGVKEVGDNAFFECSNIDNIVLDNNSITKVGDYAFYLAGSNLTTGGNFEFMPVNECYVANYAFYSANSIKKIIGNFSHIDSYAFAYLRYISQFSVGGTLSELGGRCFQNIGVSRRNSESNKFYIDFRKGRFSKIENDTFAGTSNSSKTKYMEIRLPASVNLINSYAFAYSDHLDIYFYGSPATLNSTAFNNATNFNIYVPIYELNNYKTATNWSAIADNIYGFETGMLQQIGADITSGTTLTISGDVEIGDNLLACVITRSASETPTGWTLLASAPAISSNASGGSDSGQYLNLYSKTATSTTESITITQASSGRLYANIVNIKDKTASVLTDLVAEYANQQEIIKHTQNQMLLFTGTYLSSTATGATALNISGDYDDIYYYGTGGRLSMIDSTQPQGSTFTLTTTATGSSIEFNTIGVELI